MTEHFNPNNMTFGFIGLGLIGGSMAKALRHTYDNCKIIAYNRSEAPRIMAKNDGTCDIVTDTIDNTFSECDFIFLCTPVKFNETYLNILKPLIKDTCIVSDVGSVKGNIHEAAKKVGMTKNFIGGHPMCGSEKTGYEHSSFSLCMGASYPITTNKDNNPTDIQMYKSLIESIGFKPVLMTPNDHDFTTAVISHVPHLIAANLALLAKKNEDENFYMQKLAAGGFKDTTRVAASSADVWSQICLANSENIANLLDVYIDGLSKIKKSVENKDKDAIVELFIESKEYRDLF